MKQHRGVHMKKVFVSLLAFLLVFVSVFLSGTTYTQANTQKIKEIEFTASEKMEQKQTITIPNLLDVEKVTVDNGVVSYKKTNENVELTVNKGEEKKVQKGGELIPAVDKFVTNQLSPSYNKEEYVGTLNPYVYSGSYTPSDTKYVTGQTSSSYNSGGYKGTLSSYLYSGSYTSSDSYYVTNQTSSYYNSGGYSGSLSSYLYSGSYTPSESRTETSSGTGSFTCSWSWDGSSWYEDGGYSYSIASSVPYNSGGFSGTLSQTSRSHATCSAASDIGYKGSYKGQHASASKSAWASYSGTVTKPGYDTRVYRYQGTVTKPAVDTRVYRYQGDVTKPAEDTRIYRYEGTVTKPAIDTRTYDTYYSYQVKIYYSSWDPVVNPISTDGLTLDGISQYFLIPDSNQLTRQGDFTWGVLFKPQSLNNQTILSNDAISISLDEGELKGRVKTETGTATVGFDSNYLFLDSWTFIAISLSGNTLSFYYNEQLVDTEELSDKVDVTDSKNVVIGAGYVDGISSFLNGDIKSVGIWDKALSISEIQQASQGQFSDGVGSWDFENYTTALSYDKSENHDAVGKRFSPSLDIFASDIDDMGMHLRWTKVPNVSAYEVERDGQSIYSGHGETYYEDALVSDTSFSYTITPKGVNGEGIAATNTFKTAVGSLEILTIPNEMHLSPLTLTGEVQKSIGSFDGKIIVKDTRKERNGWKLTGESTVLTSIDQVRKFPAQSITLQPLQAIEQSRGLKQDLPSLTQETHFMDDGSKMLVNADSTKTGFGIYELTIPDYALEVTFNPAYSYVNPDGSPLDYQTSMTWTIVPGNE